MRLSSSGRSSSSSAGAAAPSLAGGHIGFLGVSIAFGLTLLAMAYAIGPISGCHINPAVTLGLLLSKKMPAGDVAGYVAGQVLGGIAAAGLLLLILKGGPNGYDLTVPTNSFAANGYGEHSPDHYGLLSAFLVEVILTFFLVFTVLGTTDIKAPVGFAGIPIGLVLVLIHLVGIPVTNTSVNPARSISQAVFVGGWALQQLWLFIVAPCIGAAIASFAYSALRTADRDPDRPVSARRAEAALPSQQDERA